MMRTRLVENPDCGVSKNPASPLHCRRAWLANCLVASALCLLLNSTLSAEPIELREAPTDERTFQVNGRMEVSGQLSTATAPGKSAPLNLGVEASWFYQERRLPGAGRDSKAFRSVRKYEKAGSKIQAAEQTSNFRLRDDLRLIVAEGQPEGIRFFSPSGPLTSAELDLLDTELDPLSALALLPEDTVEPGDEWSPKGWVFQFLAGVEAVEKSSLKCRLESLKNDIARITFAGTISAGILGSATEIQLTGHLLYDVARHSLSHLEVTQTEKRSISPGSPGMDLTAKVIIERSPSADAGAVSPTALKGVPLEANPASLLLVLEPPELNVRCYVDRSWRVFHQSRAATVLRLFDKGSLIAQCSISATPAAAPGKHTDENQFQLDVQRALGDEFRKILQAEVIPTKDKQFILRVNAVGESKQSAKPGEPLVIQWIYYLITAPDGRQVVLAFTIEDQLVERLEQQDLAIAASLEFLPPPKLPSRAEKVR